MAYIGKIQARSPYYITATGSVYITSAELRVFIWSGLLADKPVTATYTLNKNAKTSAEANIVFEISHLIRDYFKHSSTGYIDTNYVDALWVEYELDVVQTTSPNPATENNYFLAFDGYSEFSDGVNYQGDYSILHYYTESKIRIPIYVHSDGADGADTVKTYLNSILVATIDYTVEAASTDSNDKIAYFSDDGSIIDEVRVYDGVVLLETFYINKISECQHDIRVLKFYDKLGFLQLISFFKKSVESIALEHDYYNSMIGGVVSNSYTYDVKEHSKKALTTVGALKETINSGFVDESMNETFKQVLASEFVWVDDKPVVITTSEMQLKTKLNDKLIDYALEIEYANNFINDI